MAQVYNADGTYDKEANREYLENTGLALTGNRYSMISAPEGATTGTTETTDTTGTTGTTSTTTGTTEEVLEGVDTTTDPTTDGTAIDGTGSSTGWNAGQGGILDSGISTAYSGIGNVSTPTYASPPVEREVTPGASYVTPESLVSEQLTSLLAEDSPYMQQVEANSRERSNQLGLLSSSMAVGAGQRAAIQEGLPIATADAGMYGQFQAAEQAAEYGITSDVTSAELSAALSSYKTGVESAYQAALQEADAKTTALLTEAGYKWEEQMQTSLINLEGQWQASMLEGQTSASQYESAMASVSNILLNTQSNISALLADPDVASMDADAVANMLNSIQANANASIEFVSGLGNIPQSDIDTLLESYELATTWSVAEEVAPIGGTLDPLDTTGDTNLVDTGVTGTAVV